MAIIIFGAMEIPQSNRLHSSMIVLFIGFLTTLTIDLSAQIRPPGYDREMEAMEARRRTNVLDRDSVMVADTVTLFDPATEIETIKVINSNLAWRDYIMYRLGITQPDVLLNGNPMTITDPRTYEKITIQWNASAIKLDTIRQH